MFTLQSLTRQQLAEIANVADACNKAHAESATTMRRLKLLDPLPDNVASAERALTNVIESLDPTAMNELGAMMALGRGDTDGSAEAALAHFRNWSDPEEAKVDYIASKTKLSDHLRKAIAYLDGRRKTREEVVQGLVQLHFVTDEEEAKNIVQVELDYETAVQLLGEDGAAQTWDDRHADRGDLLELDLP